MPGEYSEEEAKEREAHSMQQERKLPPPRRILRVRRRFSGDRTLSALIIDLLGAHR